MRILTSLLACLVAVASFAAADIGKAAPDFTGKTLDGKTVSLADFKGKTVVLEWYNPGCPYVKKFYDAGKMQERSEGRHRPRRGLARHQLRWTRDQGKQHLLPRHRRPGRQPEHRPRL